MIIKKKLIEYVNFFVYLLGLRKEDGETTGFCASVWTFIVVESI